MCILRVGKPLIMCLFNCHANSSSCWRYLVQLETQRSLLPTVTSSTSAMQGCCAPSQKRGMITTVQPEPKPGIGAPTDAHTAGALSRTLLRYVLYWYVVQSMGSTNPIGVIIVGMPQYGLARIRPAFSVLAWTSIKARTEQRQSGGPPRQTQW